jgi:hypothetical protein
VRGPSVLSGASGTARLVELVVGTNRNASDRTHLEVTAFVRRRGRDKETSPSPYPDPIVHPRHRRMNSKGCAVCRTVQNKTIFKLVSMASNRAKQHRFAGPTGASGTLCHGTGFVGEGGS